MDTNKVSNIQLKFPIYTDGLTNVDYYTGRPF